MTRRRIASSRRRIIEGVWKVLKVKGVDSKPRQKRRLLVMDKALDFGALFPQETSDQL